GYGRLPRTRQYGYPAERYMPAVVGCNDARFAPGPLSGAQAARFTCDVSFVSHASAMPQEIVASELASLDAAARQIVGDTFDQLRAVYDRGDSVTQPVLIRQMIDA